jgi:hypothetical protein
MLPRKTPCRLTVPRYIHRWKCFAHAISRPRTFDSFAAFPWLTEFSGILCPVNQPNQYLDVSQPFKVPHQSGRKKSAAAAVSSPDSSSRYFTGTEKESFSTNGDGELPIVTFSGNKLNLESQTGPGCGYPPAEIQTAYITARTRMRTGTT